MVSRKHRDEGAGRISYLLQHAPCPTPPHKGSIQHSSQADVVAPSETLEESNLREKGLVLVQSFRGHIPLPITTEKVWPQEWEASCLTCSQEPERKQDMGLDYKTSHPSSSESLPPGRCDLLEVETVPNNSSNWRATVLAQEPIEGNLTLRQQQLATNPLAYRPLGNINKLVFI